MTTSTPPEDRDRNGHPDGVPVPRPGPEDLPLPHELPTHDDSAVQIDVPAGKGSTTGKDGTTGKGGSPGKDGSAWIDEIDAQLIEVLQRSRDLGFLGPGEVESHVRHAGGFLPGLEDLGSGRVVVDLGSGGGVPGLVLAVRRPDLLFILLDASERRTEFLEWAVARLDAGQRVTVVRGRAEELARTNGLRGVADAVTARSFGSPPVTAECAVGFLGGPPARLLVSEPPAGDPSRWPSEPLAKIGLRPGPTWTIDGATVTALDMVGECPEGLPRRTGVPSRRPLF